MHHPLDHAPETPDLPAQVGDYRIEHELGRGAMGVVVAATHGALGRRVALKLLLPCHAGAPTFLQRFRREAMASARVAHPNLVRVFDLCLDGPTPFIVMELLHGEDLRHRLRSRGPIPCAHAVDLLLPVCDALAAAHDAGVIHRDLKPANLFVTDARPEAVVKVLDFGVARLGSNSDDAHDDHSTRLTRRDMVIGTWRYMAPESFFDAWCATGACDQFAMAVILHQCVTGRFPFEADGMRAQYEAILAGRRRPIEEGSVFDEVLRRALSPTPGERFPCMRAFGAALLPFASELVQARWRPVFPDAAPAPEAPATPVRARPPWHLTASAATLAVVCTAALVTPRAAARPSPPPTDATPPSAPVAAPHAPPLAPVAQTSATPTPPAASSSPPTSSDLAKTAPTPSVVHRRNALPHVPLVDALVAPSPAPPAGPRLVCDATGRCTVGRTL